MNVEYENQPILADPSEHESELEGLEGGSPSIDIEQSYYLASSNKGGI